LHTASRRVVTIAGQFPLRRGPLVDKKVQVTACAMVAPRCCRYSSSC